jgi:hypothetical protein
MTTVDTPTKRKYIWINVSSPKLAAARTMSAELSHPISPRIAAVGAAVGIIIVVEVRP